MLRLEILMVKLHIWLIITKKYINLYAKNYLLYKYKISIFADASTIQR